MVDALAACPFCGNINLETKKRRRGSEYFFTVECHCGCQFVGDRCAEESLEIAEMVIIKDWNERF